jgi:hypothetical protein
MWNDFSFTIVFLGSLVTQGSRKKNLLGNVLLVACPAVIVFTTPAPREALAVSTGNGYHLLRKTSGVLSIAATTEFEEDIDGGALGGAAGRSSSSHH